MKSEHKLFNTAYAKMNLPDYIYVSLYIRKKLILGIELPVSFIEHNAFELIKQLDDLNEIKTQKT